MENFASILERDYGFKSGKNAPMAPSSGGGSSSGSGYGGIRKTVPGSRMSGNANTFGQEDPFGIGRKNEGSKSIRSSYGSREDLFSPAAYNDVFGGPPKSTEAGTRYDDVFGGGPQGSPVFDDLLAGFGGSTPKNKSASGSFHSSPRRADRNQYTASEPVYDELFGYPSKSRSSVDTKTGHDPDPFVPLGNDSSNSVAGSSPFVDDGLLPGFETTKSRSSSSSDAKASRQSDPFVPLFDDPVAAPIPPASSPFADDGLLPGFSPEPHKSRSFNEAKASPVQDSFVSLGDEPVPSSIPSASTPFDDPLNLFSEPSSASASRAPGNGVLKPERLDSFDSFTQSPRNSPFFRDSSRKSVENRPGSGTAEEATSVREGFPSDGISEVSPDSNPFFPSQAEVAKSPVGSGLSEKQEEIPAWDFASSDDQQQVDRGSTGGSRSKESKGAWLTLHDMKLMTQPSAVPPPSRRPPPLPGSGSSLRDKSNSRDPEFVTSSSSTSTPEEDRTGRSSTPPPYEQAVPGWMDFKIQRDEEKEREEARAARERRRQEKEEARAAREIREKERQEREARHAREQERSRREKEREKDRAAVRIATLEARERAAQEAREKAERNAVERATGEARERAASQARARAERAAVDRAHAEARERAEVRAAVERAAGEARERAEKAAAEKAAAERAAAEARERAARAVSEKVAVERAQSEARERAARQAAEKAAVERVAAEARERAERAAAEKAAAARERSQQQRKSENDLESFFAGSSASNDARHRPASMNNSNVFGETRRSSSGVTTSASVDEWTSIFGGTQTTEEAQESRGDNVRSSKSRSERMHATRERAAKAIAEINQRDLETQREQAEKQRAGDILDAEIKRWANGKEGNLRALLSTLQYVLWPECGWTAVSLTDLINPAAVKKAYRRATLYVHPDKVQQKGATVQQKYIAEKVFDLLKEASNKFNSEELC